MRACSFHSEVASKFIEAGRGCGRLPARLALSCVSQDLRQGVEVATQSTRRRFRQAARANARKATAVRAASLLGLQLV